MKRFAAAILIFALTLSASVIVNIEFRKKAGAAADTLGSIISAADSAGDRLLLKMTEELIKAWDKDSVFLRMIVEQEIIDEAEEKIYSLPDLLGQSKTDEFIYCLIEAEKIMRRIGASESFNIQNIV